MKNKYKLKYKLPGLALSLLATIVLLASCEEEDPFVDRTVSPVLIVFDDVPGYLAGGGLTATPSITKTINAINYSDPVVLSLTVYELDKSGILDHTVGIDSIPVMGVPINFTKRDGTLSTDAMTDNAGKIAITTTWLDLGISASQMTTIINSTSPQSRTIPVTWKGVHNGQTFTRYAQVVLSKP
jgi:hypothetical protein